MSKDTILYVLKLAFFYRMGIYIKGGMKGKEPKQSPLSPKILKKLFKKMKYLLV